MSGESSCPSKRWGGCRRTFANMLSGRFTEPRMGRSLVSTVCCAWSPNKTAGCWLLVSRMKVFATLERSNPAADDNRHFRFKVFFGGGSAARWSQQAGFTDNCWNTWSSILGQKLWISALKRKGRKIISLQDGCEEYLILKDFSLIDWIIGGSTSPSVNQGDNGYRF